MNETLEQARDAVRDEESLIHFVQVLASDFAADREEAARSPPHFAAPGPRGWENGTVDAFLESAAAWVEESRGRQPAEPNPWRRFADILYAGKLYE